jgi:predicted GIY-YIG superfamily endonuclease
MFYIYGLHLKGDDEIRYVGSTCNPQSRLWAHLRDTEKGTPKDLWVKENYTRICMKILATAAERDRRKAEQRAILECFGKGHRLFNVRSAARIGATVEDVTWWLDYIEGKGLPF